MPRPKSYDRDEAIQRARDGFWEHGYQTLSVRELEALTGINRFALQTDFGGKESLFLECLDLYSEDTKRYILEPMDRGGIESIASTLLGLVTPAEGSARRFGCLMVNTSVENAILRREPIEARTRRHFRRLEQAAIRALERARSRAELRPDVEVRRGAAFFIGSVFAINVLNRAAGNVRAGTRYAEEAVCTVRSWRVDGPPRATG